MPKSSAPLATRSTALAWSLVALVVGLFLSFVLAREHARLLTRQLDTEFDRAVERIADGLRDQLETCGVLVRAVQTLFMPPEVVTQDRFEQVYANLQARSNFPGLIAMAHSRRVVAADGTVSYVTEHVAPVTGNEAVVGLDVNDQPRNRQALDLSRDTNEPALSGSFRLVQRAGFDEPIDGITLRLPIYGQTVAPESIEQRREHFVGSLAVSFRVSQLIANALPQAGRDDVQMQVIDVTQGESQILYVAPGFNIGDRPVFSRDIRYGGRSWRVELTGAADAAHATDQIPRLTFAAGAVASLLLALWLHSLRVRRERAMQLAGQLSGQFRDSETRFRVLNELLPAAVVLARARDGRIVYINKSGRDLLGLHEGQTSNRSINQLFEDEQLANHLVQRDAGSSNSELVTRLLSLGREPFWASVVLSNVEIDAADHLIAVITDITDYRALTDRLRYQATHDSLTDLFNRREFERLLEAATHRGPARADSGALLYLDLDQFKLINDTSGHVAGDQLLSGIAAVLKRCIGSRDVLARLGGDEFGLLLDSTTREGALKLAEGVRQAVDDFSFAWEGKQYALTASIGIVMIEPGAARGLRELLSLADTACYMAKERGRNRIHLFSDHDLETTRRRSEMEWASRLRQALAENRFTLYYQEIEPLRSIRDPGGVHFELLVRLRDEQGALVPPGAFVPAAERYNLMPQLDRWVLHAALANFDRLHPDHPAIGLCSINLSGNTLEDESFPDFVVEQLARFGVSAERLCFEITETAAVGNMGRVTQFIQRLRALGCRFALDDFGVGMSSFGYLKNLPVDFIKIDGSFIRELETDPMSYSIVRAVTEIGHQVGVEVVAEFVGNSRTRELLRGLGVDYAQGFAVHVPAPTGMP